MRHTTSSLKSFVSSKRFIARGDAIEWEELPSLADSLSERLVNDPVRRRNASLYDGAPVSSLGQHHAGRSAGHHAHPAVQ